MGFLSALPAIGSILGGIFGGGAPKLKLDPYSEAAANQLNPIMSGIMDDINNFSMGPAFKFFKRGMKSLNRGEDLSMNPVAAPYLAMRAGEKATQSRAIARNSQKVAATLPPGAEHLTDLIRQQEQNDADQTNAIKDATGVADLISSIPGQFESIKSNNLNRLAGLRDQYTNDVGYKNQILHQGARYEPTLMQRIASSFGSGMSMLPALMGGQKSLKVPSNFGSTVGNMSGFWR